MDYKGTILLVDNDPFQNNAIQCEFIFREYEVLIAMSYGEARSMLKETEPDLILMEAILPDGDGFEFFNEIRSMTLASIVFLTVKRDEKDMVRGLRLGADEYIIKPFDKEVMVMRVEAVMQWRKKMGHRIQFAYSTNPG